MGKVLKKLLKTLLVVVFISIVAMLVLFFIFKNLFTYSPYYAKQLNNKGEYREVIFIIENLSFVNRLYGDYHYDYENLNAIEKDEYIICASKLDEQTCILYENYQIDKNHRYLFDNKLNLIMIKNVESGIKDEPITEEKEERVKKWLLCDIQPFLDIQKKPYINLQWVFNYMYEHNIYWLYSDVML